MKPFSLSVPGNLLLAGEYAVTEEGGLGLTISPGPRIILMAQPSDRWVIEGVWPGGGEVFSPGETGGGLTGAVWQRVFPQGLPQSGPGWAIKVDSSAFFGPGGRKKGFGSSAAAAAVLTAALIYLAEKTTGGRPEAAALARKAFLPAVEAHRTFQGGKGSGYDVAASLFGGTGIFTGGRQPRWEPAVPALPRTMNLVPGPEAVKTVSALREYSAWKQACPGLHQEFLNDNNSLVSRLVGQDGSDPGLLFQLRDLSRQLGRRIGVSADWDPPFSSGEWGWKALGAGNELILLWNSQDGEGSLPGEPMVAEKEGLRWEPAEA